MRIILHFILVNKHLDITLHCPPCEIWCMWFKVVYQYKLMEINAQWYIKNTKPLRFGYNNIREEYQMQCSYTYTPYACFTNNIYSRWRILSYFKGVPKLYMIYIKPFHDIFVNNQLIHWLCSFLVWGSWFNP